MISRHQVPAPDRPGRLKPRHESELHLLAPDSRRHPGAGCPGAQREMGGLESGAAGSHLRADHM